MRGSLVPAYRTLHKKGEFPGYSIEPYLPQIATLVKESGAQTLLDYGCGKGWQYTKKRWHEAWGIQPALYDPAVAEFSIPPKGRFDGTICTDVLEHIPLAELDGVIDDLVYYSKMWCFVSVCCRPAKKKRKLLDGRNVHVTIRPQEWWREMLERRFSGRAALHIEFTP